MMKNFREKMMQELYTVLEIVLMNNSTNQPLTRGLLEQRYADLSRPGNAEKVTSSL